MREKPALAALATFSPIHRCHCVVECLRSHPHWRELVFGNVNDQKAIRFGIVGSKRTEVTASSLTNAFPIIVYQHPSIWIKQSSLNFEPHGAQGKLVRVDMSHCYVPVRFRVTLNEL